MKNEIFNPDIIKDFNQHMRTDAALAGRRSLALVGITFGRPFTEDDDHDLVIPDMSLYQKTVLGRNFLERADGAYRTDSEMITGCKHYYFWYHFKTWSAFLDTSESQSVRNCLFVNKDLITTKYKGILIADPEQTLYYKSQYIETSPKHAKDFENINKLVYNLKML